MKKGRFSGALAMVGATGCYVASDTLTKLATANLPPFETLTLRGVSATLSGTLLVASLGQWSSIPSLLNKWVLARNSLELAAVLCYILALANLPIANVIALLQITPLVVLLGASLFSGERLGAKALIYISLGFAGAMLIAHPTPDGFSSFAFLALATAVVSGVRDLVGRNVPARVSGLLVALGASVLVLVGATAMHLALEGTILPEGRQMGLLAASGFLLFGGHLLLFSAYRLGPVAVVAPLYYLVTLWAVLAGAFVFRGVPDTLAISGILVVVMTGVATVVSASRRSSEKSSQRRGKQTGTGYNPL